MVRKPIRNPFRQRKLGRGQQQAALRPALAGTRDAWMERCEDRLLMSGVDLTLAGAAQGGANDAIFARADDQPTGTGVINAFLGVNANGKDSEKGYNTAGALEFDTMGGAHTRALTLGEVSTIDIGGRMYREFMLDVDQEASAPLLTLESLQIWMASQNDFTDYATWPTASGPAKVYDLDVGPDGDSWVLMDYNLAHSGNGQGNVIAYIPDSAFAGWADTDFVYLYSELGLVDGSDHSFATNDGFEEWYVGTGMTPTGEIHGYKFEDVDGDGLEDAGEGRLAGWTFYLDANNNGQYDSGETTSGPTGADGEYHFTGLAAGLGDLSTYRVREMPQTGWVQTTPNPADINLDTVTISGPGKDVTVGQVYIAYDGQAGFAANPPLVNVQTDLAVGNFEQITIRGQKFQDFLGNGSYDGPTVDKPWPGWTVELWKDNGDGVLDKGTDTLIDTAITGPDGTYLLDGFNDQGEGPGVGPGTYFVTENPPLDQTFPKAGTPSPAGDVLVVQGPDLPWDYDYKASTRSGNDLSGLDFGNWRGDPPSLVSISGLKFEDSNVIHLYEPGVDTPLDGWEIQLYLDVNRDGNVDAGDLYLESDITGPSGRYDFPVPISEGGHFAFLPGWDDVADLPYQYLVQEVIPPSTATTVATTMVVHKWAGDANMDDQVGTEDFGLMKEYFGQRGRGVGWGHGDFNGDGEVGPEDFGLMKDHFGKKSPTYLVDLTPVTVTVDQAVIWESTTPQPAVVSGEKNLSLAYTPLPDFTSVLPPWEARYNIDLAIGNRQVRTTGTAHTLGFWSNKNGYDTIRTSLDLASGQYGALVMLGNLNLMGPGTTPFDPDPSLLDATLHNWLLDGNAVDMHYMLSVQLAAMALNEYFGLVAGTDRLLVTNPDGTTRPLTVDQLIAEANLALIDPTATREYQESLKNALDDGNNNLNWLP